MHDDTPITRDWLRASNELARTMPRTGTSPEGARAFLAHLYDEGSARLGSVPGARKRPLPRVAVGEGSTRTVPTTEGDGDGYYFAGDESDGRLELAVYGLGRALEKATQVARFGAFQGSYRARSQHLPTWSEGLRR